MKEYTCDKGCCNYIITEYRRTSKVFDNSLQIEGRIKKSGCFITNTYKDKILLVQSRGQYWGPPKGSLNVDESVIDGAIREVKEETGIDIDEKMLDIAYVVKGKALYYLVSLNEEKVKVQSHIADNDANGIGWFSLECLNDLIKEEKILINQHTRILLKKFLNVYIP